MKYEEPRPHIDGWMGYDELQWLFETAMLMGSIVEVGSWEGRSTHALLSGCKGTVFAVDHFKGSPTERDSNHVKAKTTDIRRLFDGNVGTFPNLKVLEMDSAEAAATFADKSIDMVFIDGDHSYEYVKTDLLSWLPKCRVLLCGHDASQDGVPRALREILGEVKIEVGSIWGYRIP